MRILIVEDEAKVAGALQEGLEREEYAVVVARVQVNNKVVEISLLQSGKWNALNELEWSRVLSVHKKGSCE